MPTRPPRAASAPDLSASDQRYRRISDLVSDYASCWRVEPDGRVVREWVTDAFTRLTGYSVEEIDSLGGWTALVHPDDLAHVRNRQETLVAGQPDETEYRLLTKDGRVLWVSDRGYPEWSTAEARVVRIYSVARDVTARQEAQAHVARNAAHLAALSRMGQTVASSLDEVAVLQRVLDEVRDVLHADGVAIFVRDGDDLTLEAVQGEGAVSLIGRRMPAAVGLAGQVLSTGEPALINDPAARSQLYLPLEQFVVDPVQSAAAVALKLHGEIVGVIEAVHEKPGRFDEEDLGALEAAAIWASIAIGNARQQARIQRRLQEIEAMSVISQALNETRDLDKILQMIVDAARRIIPHVEQAVIHLLYENPRALRPAAVSGLHMAARPDYTMRPGEGIAGLVLADGRPINVGDIRLDRRYLPLGRVSDLRSLLVAPVQSGERRLGTISVQSTAVNAFSIDDEQLLKTLGLQAALAIENARLLAAESAARELSDALRDIGAVLSSTLDFEHLLDLLLDQVGRLVPFDSANLLLARDGQAHVARHRGYEQFGAEAAQTIAETTAEIDGFASLRRMAATGQPVLIADTHQHPDWQTLPHLEHVRSWVGAPIVNADGRAVAFFNLDKSEPGFYTDDHALRLELYVGQARLALQNAQLYADLQRSLQHEKSTRAQLVQAEKLAAMGRLVASVAHELNNPLQAIQNALYLVRHESSLSAQAREDMQVALTEADRMAGLISRLRETYRPVIAEQFQAFSLNVLVEDVRKLITTHMRHAGVSFNFDPDSRLPQWHGIRDQIKQVILNLCLNAIEAMPEGGELTVQTRYLPVNGEALLTVSDNGVGIDRDHIANIFDPFFTTKEGGTGLGLMITYEIIQRHQGRITVESQPGQGTAFRIWLPYAERNVASEAVVAERDQHESVGPNPYHRR